MAELKGQKWTKSEKILGINKVSINEFLRDHLDSYLTIQTKSVLRLPWLAVATTVWPKHLCSLYTFSLQVGPAQDAAAKCCSSFLRTWIVPPVRCWRESPWKDLLIYNPKNDLYTPIHPMRLTQTLPPSKEIQYWLPYYYYGIDSWLTSRIEHTSLHVQNLHAKVQRDCGLACQWCRVGRAGVIASALSKTVKESSHAFKTSTEAIISVGHNWSSKTGRPRGTNQTQ